MSSTFALLTSDSSLLRCQVDLLAQHLRPVAEMRPRAVGLGYVEADRILLRKKPAGPGPLELKELIADVVSEVLFFHASPPALTSFADEDVMPLRYRRWMFLHQGASGAEGPSRAALLHLLPGFLQRQVKGTTASEICFLLFMNQLREAGHGDDFDVPPVLVGQVLGEVARRIERVEREAGRAGSLGFGVTDGRVMAFTRLSSGPLFYALLEGIARCERCGITETTRDADPLLRPHRRVRGVALATELRDERGFIEVPEGSVLTVGRNLEIGVAPLPPPAG